jgi:non-canonical (house-cleaning) NTP pyrophosphatase
MELGKADSIAFNKAISKQRDGTIGYLTHNVVTRTSYYIPAVILAFIPFMWGNMYFDSIQST